MNVAPLKRFQEQLLVSANKEFPRLNERGSIEAVAAGKRCRSKVLFPRLNERGSIEAFSHSFSVFATAPFPRLNERGSIEASSVVASISGLARRFHV